MENSEIHELLSSFWDWMHYQWTYSSHMDGCASSEFDKESFKKCVDKFIKETSRLQNDTE